MEILLACLGIILVVGLSLVLFGIGLYNSIQTIVVLVDEAWSGVKVQLKKRFDLIPNLVETVKGYATHEEGTFTKIAELRSGMMNANSPEEVGKLEGELRGTLKTLFAVAENYPELKANQNFLSLQTTLQQVEESIEMARRYYNGTVRDLNTKIIVFPNNIIAGFLGLKARQFFDVDNAQELQNVNVSFAK